MYKKCITYETGNYFPLNQFRISNGLPCVKNGMIYVHSSLNRNEFN